MNLVEKYGETLEVKIAAKLLGYNNPDSSLRKVKEFIDEGKLKGYKPAGLWLVDTESLQIFFDNSTIKPGSVFATKEPEFISSEN